MADEAAGQARGQARGQSPDEAAVRRLGELIYGTLVLMSVLTYLSEESTDPVAVTVAVAGSAVTLFLSRWFAEVLADTVASGKVPRRGQERRIVRNAAPLLAVAVVPVVLLVLASVHVLSLESAVNMSLSIGAVSLALWGFVKARRAGAGPLGTVFITVSTLGIGLVLVTLKAAF